MDSAGVLNAYESAASNEAGGFFRGTGKDFADRTGNSKAKLNGNFKKIFPSAAIGGSIIGILFSIGGTFFLQTHNLIEQLSDAYDSMFISTDVRSNNLFRMQMDNDRYNYKDPVKGSIFKRFSVSNKQAVKLRAQGIDYDDDFGGIKVLKFDDGTGEIRVVAAKQSDVANLNQIIASKNLAGEVDATTGMKFNAEAVTYDNLYRTNSDFSNGVYRGSMTWRGKISNWFGNVTLKFLRNNKLTRNMFKDFQNKIEGQNNGNTRTVAQEIIRQRGEDVEDGGFHSNRGVEQETDENGNPVMRDTDGNIIKPGQEGSGGGGDATPPGQDGGGTRYEQSDVSRMQLSAGTDDGPAVSVDNSMRISNQDVDVDNKGVKITGMDSVAGVNVKLNNLSGAVQKSANVGCSVLQFLGMVTILVTASQTLKAITAALSVNETDSKSMAGHGDEAPVYDIANSLNMIMPSKHVTIKNKSIFSTSKDNSSNITANGINDLLTEEETTYKAAMQANAIGGIYTNTSIDPSDPSVMSFNFSKDISTIMGGIGVDKGGFETCMATKLAANITSAVTDAVKIISCIVGAAGAAFTFGASAAAGCSGLIAGIVKGIAISVAIGVLIAGVISSITPLVAAPLTRDLFSMGGEDWGTAIWFGYHSYKSRGHRANGGSLATRSKYLQFVAAQKQVIAENAKFERQNRSPFDPTSKYTFFGTLLTHLLSFTTANSSLTGIIKNSSTLVSSSVASLMPTAFALDMEEKLPTDEEYADTCPYLASIGAVGDAACNPYIITDVSTLDMDPVDVINYLDNKKNVPGIYNTFEDKETSDGNVIINERSDLAKYIYNLTERQSPFGIVDYNVVSNVTKWAQVDSNNNNVNVVANSAIGALPIVGDVIDAVDSQLGLDNIGYITGDSIVAGNDLKSKYTYAGAASPSWEETGKYYQRFIEDQSLMESMGLIEKSAVAVLLDDYYEKNPLDMTYEGMLARYSGLPKETVVAVIDLMEYVNYLAEYQPNERYAFGEPAVKMEKKLLFDNDFLVAKNHSILLNQISFADIRNRSFAV